MCIRDSLNPKGILPDEVVHERDAFMEVSSHLTEVTTNAFALPELAPQDLLIDGIQGRELMASLNNVTKYLNQIKAIKVALEIPSGMSEEVEGPIDYTKILKADVTYTF